MLEMLGAVGAAFGQGWEPRSGALTMGDVMAPVQETQLTSKSSLLLLSCSFDGVLTI